MNIKLILVVITWVAVMMTPSGAVEVPPTRTPLTEYVNAPDPTFRWEFVPNATLTLDGLTIYSVFLTSQNWLTPTDSNAYTWTHWIQVCIPDDLYEASDLSILWIDGGSTAKIDKPIQDFDSIADRFCRQSNLISSRLSAIPNQPVIFADDPSHRARSEDAMIAWTWLHYVQDPMEPDWLARLPMTKASIKAIDAIQGFIGELVHRGSKLTVPQRFITSGGSKRGWTSWMTGCVDDPRVTAIIPVVAPIPHLVPQMNEMWESLGTYSFALEDYVDVGLMPGYLNTPIFAQLLHIIDPITYQPEMAKTPKLVVVAWCDEFFEPDAQRYYWDQIPGEKYLRIVPNADHPLIGSQNNVIDSAAAWTFSFVDETITRPTYSWEIDGYQITVTASSQYFHSAKAWYSRSTIRDWRLVRCAKADCANPQAFASSINITWVAKDGDNLIFQHTMEQPGGRPYKYAAHLIEITYNFGTEENPQLFKVTSDLSTVSQNLDIPYPYPPCPPETCACGPDCPPNTLILG